MLKFARFAAALCMAICFRNVRVGVGFLIAALCLATAMFASVQDGITFLHISDTHISDYTGAHPKLREWRDRHGETVAHLTNFLATTVREQRPSFVVASGDLIDAYCLDSASGGKEVFGQIELFRSIIAKSPVPFYPGLGNHDIECYRYKEGATAAVGDQSVKAVTRQAWKTEIGAFHDGTYYSFRQSVGRTGYLFLILDDGEGGSFDRQYRASQMDWVKRQAVSHPADYLIFMMHIPLGKGSFTDDLREAAAGTGRVALALAGHNHIDGLDEIPFGDRPLRQVRTAALEGGANNWRAIRLCEDHIDITETGNPTHTLLTLRLPESTH